MPDQPPLRPADPDDFRRSLAFALTFDGRRQFKTSGEMMAQITAEHLARHLEMSGYVIMKRPPGPGHSTPSTGPKSER
jgi:hypothetical protein